MADLAGAIIHESYSKMKSALPLGAHDYWDWKPLSFDHVKYAAIVSENFIFINIYLDFVCFIAITACLSFFKIFIHLRFSF